MNYRSKIQMSYFTLVFTFAMLRYILCTKSVLCSDDWPTNKTRLVVLTFRISKNKRL